jgi:hypothetical protein
MRKSKHFKARVRITFIAMIIVVAIGGLASRLCLAAPESGGPPSKTGSTPSITNSVESRPSSMDIKKAAPKRQLTGAELYSMHCNRCHPERYPTERTAAQWKTIMLHMQVRANLPPAQARLILKYLQENSGR